jgi:hypothetical protein
MSAADDQFPYDFIAWTEASLHLYDLEMLQHMNQR